MSLGPVPGNPEELIDCANKLTDRMAEESFADECFTDHLEGKSMMIPPAIVNLLEKSQAKAVVEKIGYSDGPETLSALQLAAKNYPDHQGIISAITRLCAVEEKLLDNLMRRLAKANNIDLPEAGSFGQQGGGPGGSPMMPPQMNPMQMQLMKMATDSLDDDKKAFVAGLQGRLRTGGPPTPEEQQKMMAIQLELREYMAVMGPVLQQQMMEQQAAAGGGDGDGAEKKEAGEGDARPDQKKSE